MKKSTNNNKGKRKADTIQKGNDSTSMNSNEGEVISLTTIAKMQVYRENLLAFFTTTDYANFTKSCHDLFELSILDLVVHENDPPAEWVNKQWYFWIRITYGFPHEYIETDNYFHVFGFWRRQCNRKIDDVAVFWRGPERDDILYDWIQEIPVAPWKEDPLKRKKKARVEPCFTMVTFF